MNQELEQEYGSLSKKVANSGSIFDADKLRPQLAEIEKQAADPNLWSNPQRSQQVMREKKRLEHLLATDADLAAAAMTSPPISNWRRKAKMLTPICAARSTRCANWSTSWKLRRCSPARTTR